MATKYISKDQLPDGTGWVESGNQMTYYENGTAVKSYTVDIRGYGRGNGKDGLKVNNAFSAGNATDLEKAITYFLKNNAMPKKSDVRAAMNENGWDNVLLDLDTWLGQEGIDKVEYMNAGSPSDIPGPTVDPITGSVDNAKDIALNNYYKDLYSPETVGTTGYDVLNRFEDAASREANSAMMIADMTQKDQAMNQAKVVKQITDQVRSERMARLKSGMSESQIANQDMQSMMANVNALNENNAMVGQQRGQALGMQNTAKDAAFQAYNAEVNTRAQGAAAFSAADAGNAHYMTMQRRAQTGEDYITAYNYITGQANAK